MRTLPTPVSIRVVRLVATLAIVGPTLLTTIAIAQDSASSETPSSGNGRQVVGPDYVVDPALTDQGNPKGKQFEFEMSLADSRYFRGDDATLDRTKPVREQRRIWVYVPAAYRDGTEAPLLVIHDGPSNLTWFAMRSTT
jgi:iron(III)-enterobactin esterase